MDNVSIIKIALLSITLSFAYIISTYEQTANRYNWPIGKWYYGQTPFKLLSYIVAVGCVVLSFTLLKYVYIIYVYVAAISMHPIWLYLFGHYVQLVAVPVIILSIMSNIIIFYMYW